MAAAYDLLGAHLLRTPGRRTFAEVASKIFVEVGEETFTDPRREGDAFAPRLLFRCNDPRFRLGDR